MNTTEYLKLQKEKYKYRQIIKKNFKTEGDGIMDRYYVEMEHPRGKEDYGTFYIYMKAYDSQQIIDMIDGVIVHIEKTFD